MKILGQKKVLSVYVCEVTTYHLFCIGRTHCPAAADLAPMGLLSQAMLILFGSDDVLEAVEHSWLPGSDDLVQNANKRRRTGSRVSQQRGAISKAYLRYPPRLTYNTSSFNQEPCQR